MSYVQDPIAINRLADAFEKLRLAVNNRGPGLTNNNMTSRSEIFTQVTDTRRNINDECGYPDNSSLTPISSPSLYRDLFDRNPIATRVVQLMPFECWRKPPKVYESKQTLDDAPTEFDKDWLNLQKTVKPEKSWHISNEGSVIWEYLKRADMLSRIGSFGILLIGFDDNKNLDQPVDGVSTLFATNSATGEPIIKELQGKKAYPSSPVAAAAHIPPAGGPPNGTPGVTINSFTETDREQEVQYIENLKKHLVQNYVRRMKAREKRAKRDLAANKDGSSRRANRVSSFGGAEGTDVQYDRMYDSPGSSAGPPSDFDKAQIVGKQGIQPITAKDAISAATPPSNFDLMNPLAGAQTRGTDAQYTGVTFLPPTYQDKQPQYAGVQLSAPEYPASREGEDNPQKRNVLFLRAFDEVLVQIVQYEADIRNPRFGLPVMYRVTLNDPRDQHSGVGLPLATVRVHWSRVIHLACNRNSSEIFGVPEMRPVLNRLLDLDKIYGASGEGYWQQAFAALFLSTQPQLGPDVFIDENAMKDQLEQFFNGLQRFLIGNGLQAQQLAPQLAEPSSHIDKCIEAICIQKACPKRVFMGAERGELASSQDDTNWDDRVVHHELFYETPCVICPFIDRLIAAGVLAEPGSSKGDKGPKGSKNSKDSKDSDNGKKQTGDLKRNADDNGTQVEVPVGYVVEWPDLESLSDKDRATIAQTVVGCLVQYIQGNVESILPIKDLFVRILNWPEEEVDSLIKSAKESLKDGDNMTLPEGFPDHEAQQFGDQFPPNGQWQEGNGGGGQQEEEEPEDEDQGQEGDEGDKESQGGDNE